MTGKSALAAACMVNLEHCPIDDSDSADFDAFVRACRNRFLEDGLCMLPEFVRPEALDNLAEEATGCIAHAWFCKSTHNVYLTQSGRMRKGPGAPPANVDERQERTFVGSVP